MTRLRAPQAGHLSALERLGWRTGRIQRQHFKIIRCEEHHPDLAAFSNRSDGLSVQLHIDPAGIANGHPGDVEASQRLGLAGLQES